MKKLTDLDSLENLLFVELPSQSQKIFTADAGLQKAQKILENLGNPQEDYKSVHIAGTSGKGSTVYYVSSILRHHNFRVGTHLSPHYYDIRERFLINLGYPTVKDLVYSGNILRANSIDAMPNYYQFTSILAFSLFSSKNVDYAVIETGLGGLYDTTNTITRSDKLAVITKIGLDHTEILGSTIAEIANQKAGIMTKNGASLVLDQSADAMQVFEAVAVHRNSHLGISAGVKNASKIRIDKHGITFDYDDGDILIKDCQLATIAHYQIENACLAIATLKYLAKRDGFDLNHDNIRQGLCQTVIPGRCEVRVINGKTVILDGAHNPQKFTSLIDSVNKLDLSVPPLWLLAFKKGKDVDVVLDLLKDTGGQFIFAEFFKNSPNMHLRDYSIDSRFLATKISNSKAIANSGQALDYALKQLAPGQVLIISGSIYFLGEISKYLN